jgi:hypothetical protein
VVSRNQLVCRSAKGCSIRYSESLASPLVNKPGDKESRSPGRRPFILPFLLGVIGLFGLPLPLLGLVAGVVHFTGAQSSDSAAGASGAAVEWVGQPGPGAAIRTPARLDPSLDAGEVRGGLVTSGLTRLQFRPAGEYVVEVFVAAQAPDSHSFLLAEGQNPVGSNLRLRGTSAVPPNAPIAFRTLVGLVHGPVELWVRSSAAEYAISAVRWRPREEYERDVVPAIVARARQLEANAGLIPGQAERQRVLRQLWERASMTRDNGVEREAWLGLTRAFYWEAMRYADPGHLVRLDDLLQRALRLAPGLDVVHQMISSACVAANRPPGSRPVLEGAICRDGKPVYWANKTGDRLDAPAWAEEQRQLRIRLEQITAYWAQRQRADGSLGDGWQGEAAGADVAMLANWAPLAAGLGSPVAARAMDKLLAGLPGSGLLADGYDKRIGPPEESARLAAAGVYQALLRPESATLGLRAVAQCLPYWIRQQRDGKYRFEHESYNCRETDETSRYVDTAKNLLAVGPALWYAFLTHDRETLSRLWYWGEAWAGLMRSGEGGKPSGVIPAEMFSANGSYLGADDVWTPEGWSAEGQQAVTHLFAALADLTADARWLAATDEAVAAQPPPPAASTAVQVDDEGNLIEPEQSASAPVEPVAAPAAKTGKVNRKRTLAPFFDYRAEWDGGAALAKLARLFGQTVAVNLPLVTSEVLFTDRVYYQLPEVYQRWLFGGAAPRPDHLPGFAVTWTPAAEPYARAVTMADEETLRLKLFSFEQASITAEFRAWRLKPGKYSWNIPETKQQGEVVIDETRRLFNVPVAPGKEITVEIRRR